MENLNFDLLQKAAEFLFIPESSLSIIFLVIFIGLFIYGLVIISNCKKALKEYKDNCGAQYEEERARINQKQFLSRICAAMAAKEVPVIDLPNMFVSVGILGTFIGLGVAIHGAADLLSADKVDLNKLNEVLNVIAFKFQTSVWGTIFSLVFQKFIAEPYFVKKHGLIGEVESTIYADAVNPNAALQKQLAELEEMHASQTSMSDDINKFVSGVTDTNARQLKELRSVTDTMATQNKALMDSTTLAQSQMTKDLLEKVSNLVNDSSLLNMEMTEDVMKKIDRLVGEASRSSNTSLGELLNKVNQLVSDSNMLNTEMTQDVMQKIDRLVGEASKNSDTSLSELLNKVNNLVTDSNEMASVSARNMLDRVTAQLEEQKRQITELLEKQAIANEQLAKQQGDLLSDADLTQKQRAEDVLRNVAEQLNTQKQNIESMLDKQNELNKALVGDIQTSNDNSATYVREGVFQQIEQFKQYAGDLASKQKETQMSLEDKLHALNISLDENSETSNNNLVELRRAIDILQKAINDNSIALKDITDNFYEKQDELDALQRAEIMGFAQSFNTLLNKAGTSTAEWRKNKRGEAPKDDQK